MLYKTESKVEEVFLLSSFLILKSQTRNVSRSTYTGRYQPYQDPGLNVTLQFNITHSISRTLAPKKQGSLGDGFCRWKVSDECDCKDGK